MDRMSGGYPPPPPGGPPAFPPPPEGGPSGPPGFPPPPGGPPSFPPPSQPGPPGNPPGYPPGYPPNYPPSGYPPYGDPRYGYPPGSPPGWGTQPPGFYPLDIGRNFQLSWSLFKYAWRTLFGVGLVILMPAYAVLAAVSAVYSPVINEWAERADLAARAGQLPPTPPPGFFEAIAVLGVLTFLLLLIGLLGSGAAVIAVDDTFRGNPTSVSSALRRAASRYASLVGAQLLYFLIAIGIMLAGFVLGGVFFAGGGAAVFLGLVVIVGAIATLMFVAVRLALIVQSITLERAGAVEGFGRSWRLVANSGWRVFGYVLLIGLISSLLGAIVQAVTSLVLRLDGDVPSGVIVGTLIQGVSTVLLLPMMPLVLTLLYYDLRWRRGEPAPLPGEATRVASTPAPETPGP